MNEYLASETGLGGIFNPRNLALYGYGHQNPVILIDPDGNRVSPHPNGVHRYPDHIQNRNAGLMLLGIGTVLTYGALGPEFAAALDVAFIAGSGGEPPVGRIGSGSSQSIRGGLSTRSATSASAEGVADTTTVGRWMDDLELSKMRETGKVQESYSGVTHVADPADPLAFIKQANLKKGQKNYVEFDVPASSLTKTNEGWSSILGPNTIQGRMAAKKGLPVPEMPAAENIVHKACKVRD